MSVSTFGSIASSTAFLRFDMVKAMKAMNAINKNAAKKNVAAPMKAMKAMCCVCYVPEIVPSVYVSKIAAGFPKANEYDIFSIQDLFHGAAKRGTGRMKQKIEGKKSSSGGYHPLKDGHASGARTKSRAGFADKVVMARGSEILIGGARFCWVSRLSKREFHIEPSDGLP